MKAWIALDAIIDLTSNFFSYEGAFNFSRFIPQKILAESHTEEMQEKIGKYLSEKGYSLVGLISSQDYLYELVEVEKNKTWSLNKKLSSG